MSYRFALVASALLVSFSAVPLSAQQSSSSAMRDTSGVKATAPRGASSDSALVELGRAISALAMTVQTVVDETAKNPEVKRAAVQTASKAVSLAQRTLEENSGEIERLLAEASRRLSSADWALKEQKDQKSKPVAPAKP
jgi:hypothetical protein